MARDPMVEEMKMRPPSRWAEVVRRAGVIERYAAIARPTVEDMRACADELGCGQRQAYHYVRAWRARSAGLPDPRSVEAAGAAADGSRTGAASPARARRPGKRSAALFASGSLHGPPAAVMDCAPLGFDVRDDAGAVEPARLLVLLEVRGHAILGHALLPHEASTNDAEQVLLRWEARSGAAVAWSLGIGDGSAFGRRVSDAGAIPVPTGPAAMHAGAAMLDLVGPLLGRVRISPRRREASASPDAAVPIEAARRAIAGIVAVYNSSLGPEVEDL